MKTWQVQEAKTKLSSLIRCAKQNPQMITVHGNPEVVVLSAKQYSKLSKTENSILEIMQSIPYKDFKFPKRSKDSRTRKINL